MKEIQASWDTDQGDDDDDDDSVRNDDAVGSEVDDSEHLGSEAHRERALESKRRAAQEEKRKILAKHQTRVVTCLRFAVLLVLFVTTAVVSTGVYLYTSGDQTDDFESEFLGYADRIMDSFHTTVEHKLGAIDTLSVAYTSHALNSGSNFPNVTLPDFEIRGASARVVADSTFFRWMPLVTDDTRAGWEAYAAQHHTWLERAYASERQQTARQDVSFNRTGPTSPTTRRALLQDSVREGELLTEQDERDLLQLEQHARQLQEQGQSQEQEQDQQQQVATADNMRYIPYIYNLLPGRNASAPQGSGPYLAYWQTSPVLPVKGHLNFNLLSHPDVAPSSLATIRSGLGTLSPATNLNREVEGDIDNESSAYSQFNLVNGQYRHEVKTFREMPLTPLQYPVFDNFGPNRQVAGVLATNVSTVLPRGYATQLPIHSPHKFLPMCCQLAVLLVSVLCRYLARNGRCRRGRAGEYL